MATVLNAKESKGYCDDVYARLTTMRDEIIKLKGRSVAKNPGKDVDGGMFGRHLSELADQIEWKLQILAHSCPVDWKGSAEYFEEAQVNASVVTGNEEISPGYVGG